MLTSMTSFGCLCTRSSLSTSTCAASVLSAAAALLPVGRLTCLKRLLAEHGTATARPFSLLVSTPENKQSMVVGRAAEEVQTNSKPGRQAIQYHGHMQLHICCLNTSNQIWLAQL